MTEELNVAIICDNGGGITLQTEGYSHYYDDDAEQVVEDLHAIMEGENPADGWDGNDETVMTYDREVEQNGGYVWYEGTAEGVLQEFAEEDGAWGANVANLSKEARNANREEGIREWEEKMRDDTTNREEGIREWEEIVRNTNRKAKQWACRAKSAQKELENERCLARLEKEERK